MNASDRQEGVSLAMLSGFDRRLLSYLLRKAHTSWSLVFSSFNSFSNEAWRRISKILQDVLASQSDASVRCIASPFVSILTLHPPETLSAHCSSMSRFEQHFQRPRIPRGWQRRHDISILLRDCLTPMVDHHTWQKRERNFLSPCPRLPPQVRALAKTFFYIRKEIQGTPRWLYACCPN